MRIYCPTHQKSFPAPRKNPIKCQNKNHEMGELDFAGRATEEAEANWAYCSDCEHFWPVEHDIKTDARCPVCERTITKRYLCHRCYTFTLESDTPADVKNFTMTKEGVPQPGCPACLKEFSGTAILYEHTCELFGASFKTSLSACPICEELIGGVPSFPASAVDYLDKVKARKKVKFSYENDLLVADEAGEFILIPNGKEHSIVLPQLVRFTNKQEFYDYYENHFHCENPTPGELIILYPAVVNKVEGGWKLKEAGRLKVSVRSPQEASRAKAQQQQVPPPQNGGLRGRESTRREQASPNVPCFRCASPVKASDTFCWKCGESLRELSNQVAAKSGVPGTEIPRAEVPKPEAPKLAATIAPKTVAPPRPDVKAETKEKKIEAKAAVVPVPSMKTTPTMNRSSILEPSQPEPELTPKEKRLGSILFLTLIGLLAFGATLWMVLALTSSDPAANKGGAPTAASQKPANTQGAAQAPAKAQNPEEDIKALRDKAKNARADERAKVLEEFDAAEKKYSQDYRFPYERAKLLFDMNGHNEAFRSLFIAGEKAIDNGKSVEMVNSLLRDQAGDFKRLAKGHKEWDTLVNALKNNDKKALKIVIPF